VKRKKELHSIFLASFSLILLLILASSVASATLRRDPHDSDAVISPISMVYVTLPVTAAASSKINVS
jgi:hypothetical protein